MDNIGLKKKSLAMSLKILIFKKLAHIGCPIKGDIKYGFQRSNLDRSIHLLARSITFMHPVTKVEMTITAQPPKDPVWDNFKHI